MFGKDKTNAFNGKDESNFYSSEVNGNSNELVDVLQKSAWRLVRSAEDRFGTFKGSEKREWGMARLKELFPHVKLDREAEDYIRSAYINFKIESGAYVPA